MANCTPTYLLAYEGNRLVARASLWLIRDEPLPKMVGIFRKPVQGLLYRWPLLVCRSPVAYTGGLMISDRTEKTKILSSIIECTQELARKYQASFILFDYLSRADLIGWPRQVSSMTTSEPGMKMENLWTNLDEYLASAGKKDRQHYKRVAREADKLGLRIERHLQPIHIEEALSLIRNVETSHGALPNPWARRMLETMDMVNSVFLTALIGEQLVGCGLLLEDNGSQMTSTLGLAKDIPYVYFALVYESLKVAFDHKIRLLRWGSGAYDVKRRLGFSAEDNASLVFTATHPVLNKLLQWMN